MDAWIGCITMVGRRRFLLLGIGGSAAALIGGSAATSSGRLRRRSCRCGGCRPTGATPSHRRIDTLQVPGLSQSRCQQGLRLEGRFPSPVESTRAAFASHTASMCSRPTPLAIFAAWRHHRPARRRRQDAVRGSHGSIASSGPTARSSIPSPHRDPPGATRRPTRRSACRTRTRRVRRTIPQSQHIELQPVAALWSPRWPALC